MGYIKADFVQDLYLRELKNYKPPVVKASDSEGHVQKFSPPKAPQSPEESDIANDLKAYEAQQVEVEGQASGAEAAVAEDDVGYSILRLSGRGIGIVLFLGDVFWR